MTQKDLQILLQQLISLPQETEWVEFKENNIQKIGEYISGLANSACIHGQRYAYLVLGIEDESHRVVGTKVDLQKKKKGNEDLEPWLARLLNPRIDFRIFSFEYEGKKVVMLRVQAAINIPVKFKGVEYIRVGSHLKKLAEYPEKQRQIWIKDPHFVFEKGIARADLGADEVLKLLDYAAYFDLTAQNLPMNKNGILERLRQEGLLIAGSPGKFDISNLGALLFAKRMPDFPEVARKSVRVILYEGRNRYQTQKEQLGGKGYASGFEGLIHFINDQLPSREQIEGAFRKQIPTYPPLIIRELVANAIIHQDFQERGTGPMIEIFADRVEITNPGKPLISPLRFIDHSPQSRNEKLAAFMRRIQICEERGSGIDKVVFACEKFRLPPPYFIEGENFTRVIIYGPKKFRELDRQEKFRATYQHCCIKQVNGEYMSNQSLRQRFGVAERNYSMISRLIAEAIEEGLIHPSDPESKSKKHARYIPFWA
ncbi:MAG: ATP-binding protein [Bacteroidota bacterium]